MSKIAKDAFASRNYHLAAEIFERCLREKNQQVPPSSMSSSTASTTTTSISSSSTTSSSSTVSSLSISTLPTTIDLYFWYGDSLARSGRLYEAFDIYSHIANQLGDLIPIERFKHLCISLIDSCTNNINNNNNCNNINTIPTSTIISTMSSSATTPTVVINQHNVETTQINYNQHKQQQQTKHFHLIQNNQQLTNHQRHYQQNQQSLSKYTTNSVVDPLLCPICEDILRCPVTASCGHTFCRECCSVSSQCPLCNVKFPVYTVMANSNGQNYNNNNNNCFMFNNNQFSGNNLNCDSSSKLVIGLKPDVLVRRLIDKWWPQELRARELNDETIRFLDINSLDDALKSCNESLEKSPNNHKSLLLRSEVLYRLNHFQSSLADADNALRSRPSSSKAYHRRALALAGLGRSDEALISQCLAACLDRNMSYTSSVSFKNEVCRLLQRFFVPSNRSNMSASLSSAPYSVVMTRRRRLMHVAQNFGTSDCDEANSSCGEDDHFVHKTRRYSRRTSNLAIDCSVPRPNTRLRNLLDRIHQEVQKIRRVEHNNNKSSSICGLNVKPSQIEVSDFDCVLCCRTLWRPVVTPCGHTYCWVCLDRCMDYSSSCPLCMSPLIEQYKTSYRGSSTPVPFSLAKKSVTKFLEFAMERFIPEWYEKRHRQEVELEPSVPVFICTTAFPHVPCPLFVYEPRYRLMVRRAIESGERQFGIVQPHTGKSRYSDVGTMLDIRDCVLLGDGCSILSTIGCRRFRILTRDEKDGYETAKVEYIYDEPILEDYAHIVNDKHSAVLRKAMKWYESLAEPIKEEILRSLGPMPDLEDNWETIADGPAWAWWIIAILPLNQQLKVNILATTSLEKRLRAIEKTLDYITGKLRRSQQSCVVVQCEGLPVCQANDCCQRAVSSTSTSDSTESTNDASEFML